MERFVSRSEDETAAIGRVLASRFGPDAIVLLTGDLGAGKTCLVRAIAGALGADPIDVSSPSFSLVHEYPIPDRPPIIHIDGYRLSKTRHEWEQIGVPELLRAPGLKLIEWPNEELVMAGEPVVRVRIQVDEDESRRVDVEM